MISLPDIDKPRHLSGHRPCDKCRHATHWVGIMESVTLLCCGRRESMPSCVFERDGESYGNPNHCGPDGKFWENKP